MVHKLALVIIASLAVSTAQGEEKSKNDSFRCERFRNTQLATLKAKLVENCNLEKPFSISATDIAVDSSYLYCCHTKQ